VSDARRRAALFFVAAMAVVGAGVQARADGDRGSWPGSATGRRISVDASGGWSATGLFGGVTDPGRGTLQLALHAYFPLIAGPRFALDYTAGIVPVELAVGTRVARSGTAILPPPATRTVYGAGVDGLGLTARFRGLGRWEPYLTALGGVRLFTDPVPDPRGIRFNFSADIGGGVAVRLAPGRRLRVGFALHHLSNGGIGQANPSFNGFSVTIGLEGLLSRAAQRARS